MLEDIESQARYLQDLASWMLEPFPRDRALVDDIVTASVDRSRAIAPSHELECDLSAGNATVDCEVVRVEGSIRNLIKNAVEYSPPEDPIVVSSRAEDGFAVINVRDHGPGIPEEHWKRIFQPYTQIDGPDRSGKGLGLFLVQSCAVQHGGHARVATSGPGGTDMELTLRLSQD
jgi:signal transduction histidine kinase